MTNTPDTARPKVYESAIDTWICCIIFLTPIASTAIGLYAMWNQQPGDATIFFILGAVVLLITIAMTLPCRYTILADTLSIRCGLMFCQVPLSDITNIEFSNTWRSGPALSMKRVLITTNKRSHILSPRDREQFIQDLNDACK